MIYSEYHQAVHLISKISVYITGGDRLFLKQMTSLKDGMGPIKVYLQMPAFIVVLFPGLIKTGICFLKKRLC
jgi:hypothetical protein